MKPILALLLTASAAHACPTGADLATGIRLVDATGEQVFTQMDDNLVSHVSTYGNSGYSNVLLHGTYVKKAAATQQGIVDKASELITTYSGGESSIPKPAPESGWRNKTNVTSVSETYAEDQSVRWEAATEMTIGNCTYAAVPGVINYFNKYGSTVEDLIYLSDLGIAILVGYQSDDSPKTPYTFQGIEAVN